MMKTILVMLFLITINNIEGSNICDDDNNTDNDNDNNDDYNYETWQEGRDDSR